MRIRRESNQINFYFFALSRADFWLIYPLAEEFSHKNLGKTNLVISSLIGDELIPILNPEIKVHKILKGLDIVNSSPTSIFGKLFTELANNFHFAVDSKAFILGDRYEMVGVAMLLKLQNIPFAHISGGESTPHSQDDKYRKCISNLATFHFPPLLNHARALEDLGISKNDIFEVGYLGWDRAYSQKEINLELDTILKNFYTMLFTYHPNSMDVDKINDEIKIILKSLEQVLAECPEAYIIITSSNHDFGGNLMNENFIAWVRENPRSRFVQQLGENYVDVMKRCKLVIGNSSSGIVEAPRMNVSSLNIGNRQDGRSSSQMITHVGLNSDEISARALQLLRRDSILVQNDQPNSFTLVRVKIINKITELLHAGKF
jgi:UDP-hydrolysing UDP-N-acetyl-D-glucosamine 2-epimerase